MSDLGRVLIIFGVVLLAVGGLLMLLPRMGLPLGRLPGDLRFETGQFTCLVPIATSIVLSILLTIGLNLLARFFNH
ncbi:MAG TPA: DUF2905 domain-containing protein [Anaerolineales bacterium]|nr:DUF2905 domain-containing protein [Anaerolineales bacterium]